MDTVRWWLHIRNKTIVDHQRCITRIMSTAVGKRQRTMYKSYKTYRGQMMGIFQPTTTHFEPSAAGWFSRKLELEKIGRCCTNSRWWLITSGISRNLQAATALRLGCPGVSFWKLPKTFWTRKVRNKIDNVEQQQKIIFNNFEWRNVPNSPHKRLVYRRNYNGWIETNQLKKLFSGPNTLRSLSDSGA